MIDVTESAVAGARIARCVVAACLMALVAGCATESSVSHDYVAAPGALHAGMTLGVLPLDNLTTYPNAGRIVADIVSTELHGTGAFRVLEASELAKRLRASGIAPEDLGTRAVAGDLAKALRVDAVVTGSVSEYGYQHGLREEPTVGVNLRVVTAGDGEVAWTASHSSTGGGLFQRTSVNEAAQRVVARMVEALRAAAGG